MGGGTLREQALSSDQIGGEKKANENGKPADLDGRSGDGDRYLAGSLRPCGSPPPAAPPAPPPPPTKPAGPPPPAAAAPKIPHTLEGRSACTGCHTVGGAGAGAPGGVGLPANHQGRTDAVCAGCHSQLQHDAWSHAW